MSRFDFLNAPTIEELDKLKERNSLINGFLLEKSINIIWGKAGLGKTWFCFGLCRELAKVGCDIVYLDADNGADILKDRGYDKIIKELNGSITYLNADLMDDPKGEMQEKLDQIEENAKYGYEKAVFIMDSLAFFLDNKVYDEAKINNLIRFSKRIRRAGGTLIIIAHSTKNGEVLRGSSNLINAVDEVWEAGKMPSFKGELNFLFEPAKRRLNVKKSAFNIVIEGCHNKQVAPEMIEVKENDWALVDEIIKVLEKKECSQNVLFKELGRSAGNKVAAKVMKRFDGIYWESRVGARNSTIYAIKKDR